MGDVANVSSSLQEALKGLQGSAGQQAKASMDKITAASAALNDVAGKLSGGRAGCAGRQGTSGRHSWSVGQAHSSGSSCFVVGKAGA